MHMKCLFVSILLFLFYLSSFSQENNSEKLYNFRVGVRLGTSVPKINKKAFYPSYELDPIGQPGINFGVSIISDLNDKLAIQPEPTVSLLNYDHPNIDYNDNILSPIRRNLLYFNLPVLFSYKIFHDKFSVQIGPQVNYLISNKISDNGFYSDPIMYPIFTRKLGLSALGGFQFTHKTFFASVRYEYGITKLDEGAWFGTYLFSQNSIQFSIGIF